MKMMEIHFIQFCIYIGLYVYKSIGNQQEAELGHLISH